MKFTIVTVTLNAGALLRSTAVSILEQREVDWEWVVKDGGSTDGSLESLPVDERVVVVRHPDRGIYDAMNQGARVGAGDYLHFLNAGDEYAAHDVLKQVERVLEERGKPDMLCGAIVQRATDVVQALPPRLSRAYLFRRSVCQQAIFYHRSLFQRFAFEADLRIYGDHDFFLCATFSGKARVAATPLPIVRYAGGGVSTAVEGICLREHELAWVREKHFTRGERLRWGALNMLLLTRPRVWLLGRIKGTQWERYYQQLAAAVNRRFRGIL